MNFKNLILEEKGHVLYLTINRPSQLNALNKETIGELHQALSNADENSNIGVIIITGSGEKAFVAGADIKEFADFSTEKGEELSAEGHRILFSFIENMNTPVIAAINGFALGGGLELAMCSHIRIASDNARLGLPEVSLGVIPGYGGTQRLAQLVGRGKAMEMIMTAGMISAEDAQKWGLVNHVVSADELMPLAEKIANKILKNSPNAIAAAIRAVNANYTDGIDGMKVEIKEFGNCFGTPEFIEGTTAFMEKRKAEFRK